MQTIATSFDIASAGILSNSIFSTVTVLLTPIDSNSIIKISSRSFDEFAASAVRALASRENRAWGNSIKGCDTKGCNGQSRLSYIQ